EFLYEILKNTGGRCSSSYTATSLTYALRADYGCYITARSSACLSFAFTNHLQYAEEIVYETFKSFHRDAVRIGRQSYDWIILLRKLLFGGGDSDSLPREFYSLWSAADKRR
ncbi:unnamed protein product, partial [Leptidea sinapis]